MDSRPRHNTTVDSDRRSASDQTELTAVVFPQGHAAPEPRFLLYLLSVTLPVLLLLALIEPTATRDDVSMIGSIANKVRLYRQNADQFDTVFLGDSRTFCGVHPDRFNRLLGVRSVNLASWAHWLPTQYAQIRDLVDHIPAGTTVVWSVGYQNLKQCKGCETLAYPIGRDNARFYAELGLPKVLYEENVRTMEPLGAAATINAKTSYQASLFELYGQTLQWLQAPVRDVPTTYAALANRKISEDDLEPLRKQQHVANVSLVSFEGRPTSIAVTHRHGGYERIEVDQAFFRNRQAEFRRNQRHRDGPPDEAFLKLFEAGLNLLAERNIKVVVNVMEEAPHTYMDRGAHLRRRAYMDTTVRRAAEERGFRYVRVDFDKLKSHHYFDYNHLNSDGARYFAELLARELQGESVVVAAVQAGR